MTPILCTEASAIALLSDGSELRSEVDSFLVQATPEGPRP
jgi:hypothetical protein